MGDGYEKLKNVVVVMIMPFDPFELNRMTYTIRSLCEEVPLEYMKIWEREQLLLNIGRKAGIEAEQANTERERLRAEQAEDRAEQAEDRAEQAEEEVRQLREELQRLKDK